MSESKIDPKRTALVVMDFQPDILKNIGAEAGELLAKLKKLLTSARAAKLPIFFVKVAFRPGHPEISANNLSFSAAKTANRLVLGTPGAEIHPEIAPLANEPVVTKHRISPLPESELSNLLRGIDANHLVLAGVSTGGCVLSTVRIAADLDYRITVLEDACADPDSEIHSFLTTKLFPRQAAVISCEAFAATLRS